MRKICNHGKKTAGSTNKQKELSEVEDRFVKWYSGDNPDGCLLSRKAWAAFLQKEFPKAKSDEIASALTKSSLNKAYEKLDV